MKRTVAVLAALLALSACGSDDGTVAVDKDAADTPGSSPTTGNPTAMPTAIPAASGRVSTDGLVTVLDDGDGPEMCIFVAESYPPQCSGTPMSGWDWADQPEREEQSGTTWGGFWLSGTFDGTTFNVTDSIPAALYDPVPAPVEDDFKTPCDEPDGGWEATFDREKMTPELMDATFTAASQLPGYAGAWIDWPAPTGPIGEPTPGSISDPEGEPDETEGIINVAVTEDPAGAEARLRETWGGALCVSEADYTEAELNEMAMELQKLPGMTTSSAADDVVNIGVIHDDGSLQAWADESYGEGRVEITSTLVSGG